MVGMVRGLVERCIANCGRPSRMPDSEYCETCAAESLTEDQLARQWFDGNYAGETRTRQIELWTPYSNGFIDGYRLAQRKAATLIEQQAAQIAALQRVVEAARRMRYSSTARTVTEFDKAAAALVKERG